MSQDNTLDGWARIIGRMRMAPEPGETQVPATGGQRLDTVLEHQAKSPHERAMDRHEAAVAALHAAQEKAEALVRAAEREVGQSLAELSRYEKAPGVPLTLADQQRVQGLMLLVRRRIAERRGEDR